MKRSDVRNVGLQGMISPHFFVHSTAGLPVVRLVIIVTVVTVKENALLTREPSGRGMKPIRRETRSK